MCIYTLYTGAHRIQKRVSDPLEQELEVIGRHLMWVLKTEPESPGRADS